MSDEIELGDEVVVQMDPMWVERGYVVDIVTGKHTNELSDSEIVYRVKIDGFYFVSERNVLGKVPPEYSEKLTGIRLPCVDPFSE